MRGTASSGDNANMNIQHITNLNDERLAPYKGVRDALLRTWSNTSCGFFMAESLDVIAEALRAGYAPVSALVEEAFLEDLKQCWSAAGTCGVTAGSCGSSAGTSSFEAPVFVATHEQFAQIAGYSTVRAPLVLFERKPLPCVTDFLQALPQARRIAVLEDVGNYANIGSAFRAAHAFGIDAVLVTPSCHDPLFRRALRHSKGTVLQVPWTRVGSVREWAPEGVPLLHEAGFKVAALALEDDSLALGDPELAKQDKLALVLGTEGEGLFPSTIAAADYTVKIPMSHEVDSLNVAAASAVAFWELRPLQ